MCQLSNERLSFYSFFDFRQLIEKKKKICLQKVNDPGANRTNMLLERVRNIDVYFACQLKAFFNDEFKDVPNIKQVMLKHVDTFHNSHANISPCLIEDLKKHFA